MWEEKKRRPVIEIFWVWFRSGEHIDLAEFRFGNLQEELENTMSDV